LHGIGYLPMYIAASNGYFAQEGIATTVLTVESGSGHTNAVLTKQAFAFIGGPEHNAFAKAKGAELRAVVNVVNRGNVYLVAQKGMAPKGRDFAGFVKGKRIATGFYSGTPNSITRYLLEQWGLDAKKDVQLLETTTAAILAAVRTKNADIGVISEPVLTQGIRQGIWEEPFFSVPNELGDYAYSTLNIRKESIDTEPKLVQDFVRAVIKGLKFTHQNPKAAAEIARKEFPTMALPDLEATLSRSFADSLWSRDGRISPAAWATGSKVVRTAGILKTDIAFDDIIDMRFV
jgi:NitT/TauT family transport system substrate-binding protein